MDIVKMDVAVALSLGLIFLHPVFCQQPVSCRWGPYGAWSECDACSQTMVRTRHVDVYSQYGGAPCSGEASQTQLCVPLKQCPLEDGCGDRFRCTSGQCINMYLVCNGDQDCKDGLDERGCAVDRRRPVCDIDKTPPNSEFTGRGYDVLTGKLRDGVINTLSFGGQCRKVFSGDHKVYYRLPQSVLRYNFEVTADNEETDESYQSSWSYMQHLQANALFVHDRRTFHTELKNSKAHRLLILKSNVELAQFQNSAPQYLPLAEGFWKALSSLSLTYDYFAYSQVLRTYGTHYLSEGSLGGQYQALLEFDRQAMESSSTADTEYQRCWRKVKRRLFRKKVTTTCERMISSLSNRDASNTTIVHVKTKLMGGNPAFIGALSVLDVDHPETNRDNYDSWASSVKDFPDVVNQKLRPLYELVKEVQCAGLKKLHLKRATEEYMAEEHPCHCRPCQNNGQPLLTGTQCSCVCKPGTSGLACERGTPIGEQPGVVHGSWTCWSSWAACSGGQRSRTRSCTNPAPRRGGLQCSGLALERKPCEEPDIQHLQMREPHCFNLTLTPPETCGPPPDLINGFILHPRDVYHVGSMVEYSCKDGYHLSRVSVAECIETKQWKMGVVTCRYASCPAPLLNGNVNGAPAKVAYDIGERILLSCPLGASLEGGVSEVMCSSSLQWSPSPETVTCREAEPKVSTPLTILNCKPWETIAKNKCVCKKSSDCQPSLQLCAKFGPSRTRRLGVCQLHELRCMGRGFTLTADSDCAWPTKTVTSCQNCNQWEFCNLSTGMCQCRNIAQCAEDITHLCVTQDNSGIAMTMTECEVGARKCAGEQVKVIDIEACQN